MMIYLSLVLSLCLQVALACVPVRPGEDLPCPSVPFIDPIDKYLLNGLNGPTVATDGTMVYNCEEPGDLLLAVEGTSVMPLGTIATISCKPNSGIFVLDDGTAVGGKKFNCGQLLIPCPDFPEAKEMQALDPKAPDVKIVDGDTIWSCMEPSYLYVVTDMVPASAMKLDQPATIICKKQSGALTVVEGPGGTERAPLGTETFACGTIDCQTCDRSIFVAETSAICGSQGSIVCRSRAVFSEDAEGCAVVSCASGSLYVLESDTVSSMYADPAQMRCFGGGWKYIDREMNVPDGANFACAELCTCSSSEFNEGMGGLCPFGKLCTKPTLTNSRCRGACPDKSSAIYLDTAGGQMTSATIQCLGADWIDENLDEMTGITCQYDENEGYSDTPPPVEGNPCAPLTTPFVCDADVTCDSLELIYYTSDDGYTVSCKNGALITDATTTGETAICPPSGQWSPPITQANCIVANAAKACLAMMAPATADALTTTCLFSACRLSCPPGKKFSYTLEGVGGENAYLRCQYEVLWSDTNYIDEISALTITCV